MIKEFLFSCVILCSILSCQKESINKTYDKIITAPGPEDIVFDNINNRILVSCNERRDGKPPHGEIQQINRTTNVCSTIPLMDFPSIPFNPHGFDLQTVNGVLCLYVINHYNDNTGLNSILQFKINTDNLVFLKEYKSTLLISPNDLTVLQDGSFYFSNDKNSSDILSLLTDPNSGSIGYSDGNNVWKKVDSLIGFPNGLYNENNRLYLATSRNFALFTYDILNDGTLQNRNKLSNINGMDNIIANGDDLIIAVHPDELKFALLSFLPATLSPSRTYSINKYTGESKVIFNDDGSLISGSSTALIVGDDLYLSQVFEGFVLKISNFRK